MSKLDDILQRHARELEEYFKKGGEENFYVPKNEKSENYNLEEIIQEFEKVATDKDTLYEVLLNNDIDIITDFINSFMLDKYPNKDFSLRQKSELIRELYQSYIKINKIKSVDDGLGVEHYFVREEDIKGVPCKVDIKDEKDDALKPYIKNLDYKSKEEKFYVSDSKRGKYADAIRDINGKILYDNTSSYLDTKGLLEEAIQEHINLQYVDLEGADLRDINFETLSLRGANLKNTNLRGANLRGAHLEDANLENSDLVGADLQDSDLRGTNLGSANLIRANLQDANLITQSIADLKRQGASF